MKAISIRQPWAWLILRPDVTDPEMRRRLIEADVFKPVENRSRPTKLRERILVHASKGCTWLEYIAAVEFATQRGVVKVPHYHALERGGIVGAVDIVGCTDGTDIEDLSRWFTGDYGYLLANPQPLPFRPYRGMLGFFEVPDYDNHPLGAPA